MVIQNKRVLRGLIVGHSGFIEETSSVVWEEKTGLKETASRESDTSEETKRAIPCSVYQLELGT